MNQNPYWRCPSSGTNITYQLHAHISMKESKKRDSVMHVYRAVYLRYLHRITIGRIKRGRGEAKHTNQMAFYSHERATI